ncbi:MAG: CidA/LrgA family protein [Roseburia sp.]|uniref:CidA/LrgA family protein n=1 Tax=Roseburia sp. 831b TaxID=1261635 RepID=UPI0009526D33|nr:CidA/LrgA family protein [Roseburia sp. 831b]MCI5920191.1 CidA/LrgA family protein [Roseburia sp.]MDD6217245.1 CidA/LrgA family protein [Roseburia sp.]MDY5883404.1 CidA/LrgA family protein [Roseburia sp.]WVK72050.1 CidA/LrgA family protein [Roseburia sp. 831b]
MKYIRQFGLILAVTFLGEILKMILPFKIPSSIYGLVLMFLALQFKVIQLEQVKEAAKYLIEIMPLMFIPAGVGLMNAWGVLKPICIPVIVITIVSTIVVMGISGRVTQFVIRLEKRNKSERDVK